MTSLPPEDRPPAENRFTEAIRAGDEEGVLRAVATSDLLLPRVPAEAGEDAEGAFALPVIEQDGTQYVPAFTSPSALAAAMPGPTDHVVVPAPVLAEAWPSDDLWLAVNPGGEDGAAIPPEAVRALPAIAAAEE